MENFDAFDFDTLIQSGGVDPFAQDANKYGNGVDTRYYTLKKDKDGNGAALIRFLPDKNNHMIQKVMRIGTTIVKNDKKRFVNELTPATIGKPCPFQEKWQELWNSGNKDEARLFGRTTRYITNIKVIKDPANPENEGKIFLFDMSGSMNAKLEKALRPSDTDIALGAKAKQLFNPMKGNSFRLVSQKGANGQINYDNSEIVNDETSIYASVQEAIDDIKNNTYELKEFLKPETYLTYEQLVDKLNWVTFNNEQIKTPTIEVAQTTVPVPDVIPAPASVSQETQSTASQTQADELDNLLKGLVS